MTVAGDILAMNPPGPEGSWPVLLRGRGDPIVLMHAAISRCCQGVNVDGSAAHGGPCPKYVKCPPGEVADGDCMGAGCVFLLPANYAITPRSIYLCREAANRGETYQQSIRRLEFHPVRPLTVGPQDGETGRPEECNHRNAEAQRNEGSVHGDSGPTASEPLCLCGESAQESAA